MTDEIRTLLRSPAMIVFLLGVIGAVVGWGVRQEFINREQEFEIASVKERADLLRRIVQLETRVDALEKGK